MTSPPPTPGPDPDPDAIAAAARACPAVARLSGGIAGEAATYLPGRRVTGVRIGDRTVTVHVVGVYGPSMAEISAEVARAVTPLAAGRRIDVVIEDLEPPSARAGYEPGTASDPRPARPADVPEPLR